jgi:hypothetical protein
MPPAVGRHPGPHGARLAGVHAPMPSWDAARCWGIERAEQRRLPNRRRRAGAFALPRPACGEAQRRHGRPRHWRDRPARRARSSPADCRAGLVRTNNKATPMRARPASVTRMRPMTKWAHGADPAFRPRPAQSCHGWLKRTRQSHFRRNSVWHDWQFLPTSAMPALDPSASPAPWPWPA